VEEEFHELVVGAGAGRRRARHPERACGGGWDGRRHRFPCPAMLAQPLPITFPYRKCFFGEKEDYHRLFMGPDQRGLWTYGITVP
jgi:hypothetical protein